MALFIILCVASASLITSSNGQQVSLTSPLESDEMFYCDQDKIICNGNGSAILWTAPPSITADDPQGFIFNAMQQTPVLYGNVAITLTNVEPGTPPLLTSELTLSNIPEVNVTCQTDVPDSRKALRLIRSQVPPIVENLEVSHLYNTSFRSTWTVPRENYDLMHYIVQVYINDAVDENITTTDTYAVVNRSCGESIQVTVEVMNRCGQGGMSTESNLIVFFCGPTSDPITTNDILRRSVVGLGVSSGVFAVLFILVSVLLIGIVLLKYCPKKHPQTETALDHHLSLKQVKSM